MPGDFERQVRWGPSPRTGPRAPTRCSSRCSMDSTRARHGRATPRFARRSSRRGREGLQRCAPISRPRVRRCPRRPGPTRERDHQVINRVESFRADHRGVNGYALGGGASLPRVRLASPRARQLRPARAEPRGIMPGWVVSSVGRARRPGIRQGADLQAGCRRRRGPGVGLARGSPARGADGRGRSRSPSRSRRSRRGRCPRPRKVINLALEGEPRGPTSPARRRVRAAFTTQDQREGMAASSKSGPQFEVIRPTRQHRRERLITLPGHGRPGCRRISSARGDSGRELRHDLAKVADYGQVAEVADRRRSGPR